MSHTTRRSVRAAALGAAFALPLLAAAPALAASNSATANLTPVAVNGSNGSGTGMVTVKGSTLSFTLAAQGLADGPHAAHIHFGADARHECPTATDDTNKDGRLSTTEGGPAYGPIVISLTKTGDTSPKSGLAVSRFASGTSLQYSRGSVPVSAEVAKAIESGQAVVVIHGVSYTGDKASAKSDLDPSLPASATDPAICGKLVAAPSGGAQTGFGGASSGINSTEIALGGLLVLGAAGTGVALGRRRS